MIKLKTFFMIFLLTGLSAFPAFAVEQKMMSIQVKKERFAQRLPFSASSLPGFPTATGFMCVKKKGPGLRFANQGLNPKDGFTLRRSP